MNRYISYTQNLKQRQTFPLIYKPNEKKSALNYVTRYNSTVHKEHVSNMIFDSVHSETAEKEYS